jgi:hypothetical protein
MRGFEFGFAAAPATGQLLNSRSAASRLRVNRGDDVARGGAENAEKRIREGGKK